MTWTERSFVYDSKFLTESRTITHGAIQGIGGVAQSCQNNRGAYRYRHRFSTAFRSDSRFMEQRKHPVGNKRSASTVIRPSDNGIAD